MIINEHDPRAGKIYQVVDEHAKVRAGAVLPSDDLLKQFYRDMMRVRAIDDKAFKLQRQGRMHTFPQITGHEAIQIAAAYAMQEEDWLAPSYREEALVHLRGVPYSQILLFWLGNEKGSAYPKDVNVLPFSIPIASHMLHAVGIGWGAKMCGEKIAVVTTFGDGATSEGEFHEAMNFAGVFKAPVVFLCTNNQWAISVCRKDQSASKTLAEKAFGYGFDGICVDGLDVVAMHQVMQEACDKARNGGGPTMIEAVTYRLCDHTTADDASIYQDVDERKAWEQKDGVRRLRKLLEKRGLWSASDDEALEKEVQTFIDQTIRELEASPEVTPDEIFSTTFADMPPRLKKQLEDVKAS
ncbi:MAG: pyruvate dehydrogenase (acetyl-transferring) E1 component subunit alpha [Deltaproteobacteria bacterium]|nr:pyruvate dehydrogenase (acetyl-transferring) E1 component subunit alpha [Deltaproteobacteria bacterium]